MNEQEVQDFLGSSVSVDLTMEDIRQISEAISFCIEKRSILRIKSQEEEELNKEEILSLMDLRQKVYVIWLLEGRRAEEESQIKIKNHQKILEEAIDSNA